VLAGKLIEESVAEYLKVSTFYDWRNRVLDPSASPIVIAEKAERLTDRLRLDLFTWSVLVRPRTARNIPDLLSSHDWLVHLELGNPTFGSTEKGVAYLRNDSERRGDLRFEPFTIVRQWLGHWKPCFDIIQEYLLYHEACEEGGTWNRIGVSGEKIVVLQRIGDWPNVRWEAPREEIRDFLAAKRMFLLRQHDHRAWLSEATSDFPVGDWKASIRDTNYHFQLYGGPTPPELATNVKFGKVTLGLFGKDVISPADKVARRHTDWTNTNGGRRYAEFIVGVDEKGETKRFTCNQAELSNYFGARPGAPHVLTGVYFDRRVLRKYYSEPERFRVDEPGGLRCLDLWQIPVDCLPDGTLHLYLSDLAHIPYEEQLHWVQFNVLHKQEITADRFKRDFDAKFTPPPRDPQHIIRAAHEYLTGIAGTVDPPILRPPRQEDSYLPRLVYVPIEDSWTDFDQQTLVLAKLVADSLDPPALKRWSKGAVPASPDPTPFDWLETALVAQGKTMEEAKGLLIPLRNLQRLRSNLAAHLKNAKFQKVFDAISKGRTDKREVFRSLLIEIGDSLEKFVTVFSKVPPTHFT